MTNTHFELMQRLQWQRDELARYVWLLAADEYKDERTLAVDMLDLTHQLVQAWMRFRGIETHVNDLTSMVGLHTRMNTALIERLNTALIAMPETAFAEVAAGLAE